MYIVTATHPTWPSVTLTFNTLSEARKAVATLKSGGYDAGWNTWD